MKTIKIVNENTLKMETKEVLSDEMTSDEFASQLRTILNCDPDDFYKKYKKYKKAEADFKAIYEPFKEKLIQYHEKNSDLLNTVIVGGVKLIYVSPSTRTSIDSKKLKEEEPELSKKYSKTTNIGATIRLEEV